MIKDLKLLIDACEQHKNVKYNTGNISFAQYHLQNALWLASLGYYVFFVNGNKVPFAGFEWRKNSTNDPKVIFEYWQRYPKGCVAIDCAKSGITVVDVDNKPEKNKHGMKILADCLINWSDLPENTPVIISPSGGVHFYVKDSGKALTTEFVTKLQR